MLNNTQELKILLPCDFSPLLGISLKYQFSFNYIEQFFFFI